MRKLLKTLLFSLILVFGLTSSVFAAASSDALVSDLQALGLSNVYIGNVLEYLQEIKMTDEQEQQLLCYVDKAENVAGGRTNLLTLSRSEREQLECIAADAAGVVGLNAYVRNEATSSSQMVLAKDNGSVILILTLANAQNVQWNTLRSAISEAKVYSQSGNGQYVPSRSYGYCKTATNNGNILAGGITLIAAAGVILIIMRKKAVNA